MPIASVKTAPEVERLENPTVQHKRVTRSIGVRPEPYNDTCRVIRSGQREPSTQIINRDEGPAL